MSRNKVGRNLVIVASDIEDDDIREEFREFIIEDLNSKSRTESVYEFDYRECDMSWSDIISKISTIINSKTDTVYLWDISKPAESSYYELYRTKIGK